jgi:hypothetical protein
MLCLVDRPADGAGLKDLFQLFLRETCLEEAEIDQNTLEE